MFHEFIDHNEQGLALDELAHAADEFDAPAKFWMLLQMAAREMQLTAADEDHGGGGSDRGAPHLLGQRRGSFRNTRAGDRTLSSLNVCAGLPGA
jgi:hypothetical protein